MMLAIWRRADGVGGGVWSSLLAQLKRCASETAGSPRWIVGVSAPSRLDRRGPACRTWSYWGAPSDNKGDARGPDVRVGDAGLEATLSAFPQQALYYYWSRDDGVFAVCSQLEPLARALPVRQLRLQRLVAIMALAHEEDPSATPFEGLRRVLPGERIQVGQTGFHSRIELPSAGDCYLQGTPDQLARELRGRLEDAILRAMAGATRVSVSVSGGLDSSSVLALASRGRERGVEVEALTLDYAGPGDDRPHMKELAQAVGIEPVRLQPADAGPFFSQAFCLDAQPCLVSTGCFDLQIGKTAIERGADVLLNGGHGDIVLGTTHGLAALACRGHLIRASIAALRMRVPWASTWRTRLRDFVVLPSLRQYIPGARRIRRTIRRRRPHRWLTQDAEQLLARARGASGSEAVPDTPDALIASRCKGSYAAAYADSAGQIACATGCSQLDAYYDSEFVEFVSRIDPVMLTHGNEYRGLFRLAMRGVLPEGLRTRRDKARFEPAIAKAALAGDGFATMRELSSVSTLASLGLVDAERFRPEAETCLAAVSRGMLCAADRLDGRWEPFWRALSVESFARTWGGSEEPPEARAC